MFFFRGVVALINGAFHQRKVMSWVRNKVVAITFEKWNRNSIKEIRAKVLKQNILRNWIQQL